MKTLIALLAFVAFGAHAQSVPVAVQVQRLAPQLVSFAGSQGNFESLVNGIALGVPVTLTTIGADGVAQTAIFTVAGGAVSDPVEIARRLEAARQQLIAAGVAAPTAQQLGEQVAGATVPITVSTLPTQPAAGVGASAAGAAPASPAQQIQSRNAPVAPQVNTSDTPTVGNTSNTPAVSTPPAAPPPAVSRERAQPRPNAPHREMGSVLYLDRGARRHEPSRAAHEASLLRPGYNCWSVAHAERVAFLVDAEAYYRAFHQAALRARRSIVILAWDFNSQTQLHFDPVPRGGPPALVGDFLNYLVRRRRGLEIHVLNWDYPMVFGADRELPPLYGFGWTPARRVHLRYDDTHPVGGCQHQKIAVIDDAVAFAGGIDLTVRRWDTPEHAAGEPRRSAYGKPYPPFHDLMVAVDGEAARQLAALARERWLNATGKALKPVDAAHDPWPAALEPDLAGVEIGIARTAPPRGEAPAVREVEALFLDMIAAARRSLYIENQYFTAPRIAAALEKRLAEPDGPEVVLVLRLLSHGWLEEATMHVLRTRLIQKLKAADRYGRFRVYYPHVPGLPEGCCLDVHSKLMVVDDRLLRIGSSNLSNRSMSMDTECDTAIESRGRAAVAAAITRYRDRLIGEHLGLAAARVSAELERAGGLVAGIEALAAKEGRTLKPLVDLPEWPEAVVQVAAVADPSEPIALEVLLKDRENGGAPRHERPAWGKLALIGAAIAALFALWQLTPVADSVNGEAAMRWAKEVGAQWWVPLALLLAYTPACFVMFPRPLITLSAVIVLGPWKGLALALTGITLAAVVTYVAGMRMRRDTVRRLAGRKLDRMIEVLKKHGLLALTLLRLVPLAPFAIEGIVAGAVRMKLWHLALGTVIGMLPGTLAATVFGHQIEAALSGTGPINWWLVALVLALLGGGSWAVKRWFSRMERRLGAHGEAAGDAR
ncbi:MAG: VTT domain-containing protein [Betaproteobacteria bacterium]